MEAEEETRGRTPFKILVTLCTGVNMVLGLGSLLAAAHGQLHLAAWLLVAAVVSDAFDGHLARLWKVSSEFGAQLDSMADMTSFNVAGSVLIFYWFSPDVPLALVLSAAALYVFMGGCRLARFNARKIVSEEFQGMPTTAVATLVAAAYLNFPNLHPYLGVYLTILVSLLMMSSFPYPKFIKMLRYPWWIWLLALGTAWFNFRLAVAISSLAYIASGPGLALWRTSRSQEDWKLKSR